MRDEIKAGSGHTYALHLKETEEGKYRDMDFGTGRVDFVSGVEQALRCGVRLFTAEFWHDGTEDWQGRVRSVNKFLREKINTAIANIEQA